MSTTASLSPHLHVHAVPQVCRTPITPKKKIEKKKKRKKRAAAPLSAAHAGTHVYSCNSTYPSHISCLFSRRVHHHHKAGDWTYTCIEYPTLCQMVVVLVSTSNRSIIGTHPPLCRFPWVGGRSFVHSIRDTRNSRTTRSFIENPGYPQRVKV